MFVFAVLLQSCRHKQSHPNEVITGDSTFGISALNTEQNELDSSVKELSNKQIRTIIENEYTKNNVLDGSEYATVDSLKIISFQYNEFSKVYRIEYYIACSFQAAAMPEEYQSTPSSINETRKCIIWLKNKRWVYE